MNDSGTTIEANDDDHMEEEDFVVDSSVTASNNTERCGREVSICDQYEDDDQLQMTESDALHLLVERSPVPIQTSHTPRYVNT
jgi:hypothetical protein